MFSRKARRNYTTGIFTAVIICLCVLIAVIAWPEQPTERTDAEAAVNPDYVPSQEEDPLPYDFAGEEYEYENEDDDDRYSEDGMEGDSEDGTEDLTQESQEDAGMNPALQTYYLVKRAGSEIVVFFCDISGNMVQLETTEILYDLLGPEDQKLFDQGIRADSQEELSVLLQDFES